MMSCMAASSSGVTMGTGEYAPMPPVFGPRSPSNARLWSWAVAMQCALPSLTNASIEHSGPVRHFSMSTVLPESPNAPSKQERTASSASSSSSATTTPLPAARPSAFTTMGAPSSRT